METLVSLAQVSSVGMALVVAFYAAMISWRLGGIDNVQAKDVRLFCCSLVWILLMWPVRYFARKFELEGLSEASSILMVPAMAMVTVAIYRMYSHLTEEG